MNLKRRYAWGLERRRVIIAIFKVKIKQYYPIIHQLQANGPSHYPKCKSETLFAEFL